jgi:hypothetical protein
MLREARRPGAAGRGALLSDDVEVHDEQAEGSEGRGEADAEGEDEHEPEHHLALGDGAEQHDERRRAGMSPAPEALMPISPAAEPT